MQLERRRFDSMLESYRKSIRKTHPKLVPRESFADNIDFSQAIE